MHADEEYELKYVLIFHSDMAFKAHKIMSTLRKIRSSGESEITTFRANHSFVAMTVIKEKTFSEIFFMNFLGSEGSSSNSEIVKET